jgi:hypothetical protein
LAGISRCVLVSLDVSWSWVVLAGVTRSVSLGLYWCGLLLDSLGFSWLLSTVVGRCLLVLGFSWEVCTGVVLGWRLEVSLGWPLLMDGDV